MGVSYSKTNRTIVFSSDIDKDTAQEFVMCVLEVLSEDVGGEVRIVINSGGGCLYGANLMIRYINLLKEKLTVVTEAVGEIASSAFAVWLSGTRKEIFEGTTFELHGFTLSNPPSTIVDREASSKKLQHISQFVSQIVARETTIPYGEIQYIHSHYDSRVYSADEMRELLR